LFDGHTPGREALIRDGSHRGDESKVTDSDTAGDPKVRPRGGLAPACALALLIVAVGCGGEPAPPPAVTDGVSVVLGTGQNAFQSLDDDAPVPLIRGLQGGWHVWTSFHAYGFDTEVLRMDLTTRWEGVEESVLGGPGNVRVQPVEDATGAPALASVGWPAIVYNPTCAHGHRLLINLTVMDTDGHVASDSRRWIMEVPEADRSSDCGS
jgi:hypothetical protein